jgi:LDH2 family malate/lactate/ureidoglycolate dehydrogenase
MASEEMIPVRGDALKAFVVRVMRTQDVTLEDAQAVADVLVASDLRGIDSHGVARLRRYVTGLKTGMMKAHPDIKILRESPVSAALDADRALGMVVGTRAMQMAIDKAKAAGIGVISVGNSNHYGIAGYYPMMALKYDMIGLSLTNARSRIVPTFARRRWHGTNPIAVAVPAGEELPYVLDMATSVVPDGKIEVYNRLGKPIPAGWEIDEKGQPNTDSADVLARMRLDGEGGRLPLGGEGEMFGGHKGFGLGILVDIMTGVLSASAWGPYIRDGGHANLGQFFAAMRVDLFRPVDEFKAEMDKMIRQLKALPTAPGHDRIYIHGEKEFDAHKKRSAEGIPLHPTIVEDLKRIANEVGVTYDL